MAMALETIEVPDGFDPALAEVIIQRTAKVVKENLTYLKERIPELTFSPAGLKTLQARASFGPDVHLSRIISKKVLLDPREARALFADWVSTRQDTISEAIAYAAVDRVLYGEL